MIDPLVCRLGDLELLQSVLEIFNCKLHLQSHNKCAFVLESLTQLAGNPQTVPHP